MCVDSITPRFNIGEWVTNPYGHNFKIKKEHGEFSDDYKIWKPQSREMVCFSSHGGLPYIIDAYETGSANKHYSACGESFPYVYPLDAIKGLYETNRFYLSTEGREYIAGKETIIKTYTNKKEENGIQ